MIITNNNLFIQTRREEDRDIINWYFDVKSHVPAESTFNRMMTKVRDAKGDDLMDDAQSLWESFVDTKDIWADRFFKVAQNHDRYEERFGFGVPRWFYDLEARVDGRVQYRIPRTRDLRQGDDHLIMSNAECDRIDMTKRLIQQQHARVTLVRELAAKRGLDLIKLGIILPKLDPLDVRDAAEDRKKAAREKQARYRAAKAKDKAESSQEAAQTPEQQLRKKLAELMAENKILGRENTRLKSENHRLPIIREAAREHAVDVSPFISKLEQAEAQVIELQEVIDDLQRDSARDARDRRQKDEQIARMAAEIEEFKRRDAAALRGTIFSRQARLAA